MVLMLVGGVIFSNLFFQCTEEQLLIISVV